MPELAEVAFYAHRWDSGIGEEVVKVTTHAAARVYRDSDAGGIDRQLAGKRFLEVRTHGKRMLFGFSGELWLELHLGMTGELRVVAGDYEAARHDHLCLHQAQRCLIFTDPRMFGKVVLHRGEGGEVPGSWSELPAEILSDEFGKRDLMPLLKRRAKTPIKTLLLDQAYFPGIGNWMADEVVWRCRFNPAALSGSLANEEDAKLLRRVLREVCRDAMRVIAPDWSTPPDRWLFNHRWKDGGFCPRPECGAALERADLRGRTTCWCPVCQVLK